MNYTQSYLTTDPLMINYKVKPNISASSSEAFSGHFVISSGCSYETFDVISSIDDSSVKNNDLWPLMLLAEQVLGKDWDTPEEDEAWANL